MAMWSDIYMNNAISFLMEQLIFFHDYSLMILFMIIIVVGYNLLIMLFNNFISRFMLEDQLIEFIWTLFPVVILLFIALPSLRLLYLLDEIYIPMISLKSIGHQWYWSYEYLNFNNIEFDSYMILVNDLMLNQFRLLDVDNRLIIPINLNIRNIISSMDVIHSWTIQSLGVKIDAFPGRLNQSFFCINYIGLFYGQCSEICGMNHSFMPIVIESVNNNSFLNWIKNFNSMNILIKK